MPNVGAIAVDAFFLRKPFVDSVHQAGFDLVTRLKKNGYLRYYYQGAKKGGPGRPKQYDGRIDPLKLRIQTQLIKPKLRKLFQYGKRAA